MTSHYLAPSSRQLDIIADTSLSAATKLVPIRQPAQRRETGPHSSTDHGAETGAHSSTGLIKLDRRRRSAGISIPRLCAAAGIHPNTYREARRGHSAARPQTMLRLQRALNGLMAGHQHEEQRTLCLALLRVVTAGFAVRAGWDAALMLSQSFAEERPQDPVWLQAARLRRCGIYVLVEGLMIRKAHLGHALGCSRQAVHKAVAVIEQERERDPAFDAVMQAMMDTVRV